VSYAVANGASGSSDLKARHFSCSTKRGRRGLIGGVSSCCAECTSAGCTLVWRCQSRSLGYGSYTAAIISHSIPTMPIVLLFRASAPQVYLSRQDAAATAAYNVLCHARPASACESTDIPTHYSDSWSSSKLKGVAVTSPAFSGGRG
jgi:hypothetical protein